MVIRTERLILRPWRVADAEELFEHASDPQIGPAAGWPPHRSVGESRGAILGVLSAPETYAICLKESGRLVGCICLKEPNPLIGSAGENDLEVGYWVGRAYWGLGFAPEALRALVAHAFGELSCPVLWCGHYGGNEKSRRCMEKCGFVYAETHHDVPRPLLGDTATERFYRLARP